MKAFYKMQPDQISIFLIYPESVAASNPHLIQELND